MIYTLLRLALVRYIYSLNLFVANSVTYIYTYWLTLRNILSHIAGVYHRLAMVYMRYTMLNFDEVYICNTYV